MRFYIRLFLCLLLCVGGGLLAGLVTRHGLQGWYVHLHKPPGTPPNIVFPIVWTLLYTLMAIALTLLWSAPTSNKKTAVVFFALQLILNFSWSWLFFGLQSPGVALIDILLLWSTTLATILAFKKHTALGASLLLPYFAWITYALYLNFYIWMAN